MVEDMDVFEIVYQKCNFWHIFFQDCFMSTKVNINKLLETFVSCQEIKFF